MIRLRPLRPREQRNLRHWAMEFVVVVAGVLLALWVAEWAEDRREAREHAQRVQRMDSAIRQLAISAAVNRAGRPCEDARLKEIKSLLDEHGRDWPGIGQDEATSGLSAKMLVPLIYSFSGELLDTDPFDAAESAGAFAALPPRDADFYRARAQQFEYYNDAFNAALDATRELRVLGEARRLSETELDQARQAVADIDLATFILRVHGDKVTELYREREGDFDASFWQEFEDELAVGQYRGADCFAPIDPRDGSPWEGRE